MELDVGISYNNLHLRSIESGIEDCTISVNYDTHHEL